MHLERQLRLNSTVLALVLNRNHFTFRLDLSLKRFAKAEVNLSFGLKPDFRSRLSFGLKLWSKTTVLAEE